MTEHAEKQHQAIGVLDAFLKECVLSRARHFSGGDATVTLDVELTVLNSPSDEISVSLEVIVSSGDGGVENESVITAKVVYVLVVSESVDVLPDGLVTGLMQFAWPYLRAAFDAITGLAHLPSLPLPLAPPSPSVQRVTEECSM